MTHHFIQQLVKEIEIPASEMGQKTPYTLVLDKNIVISVREEEAGNWSFYSTLTECPVDEATSLLEKAMQANFLGKETKGAAIGLDSSQKLFTMHRFLSYEVNYDEFKGELENFANQVGFWKKELQDDASIQPESAPKS